MKITAPGIAPRFPTTSKMFPLKMTSNGIISRHFLVYEHSYNRYVKHNQGLC